MAPVKEIAKQTAGQVFRLFSKRPAIIFESAPDFSDNTYAVYEEMVRRELHKKYTLVWSCSKDQSLPNAPQGLRYIYPLSSSPAERLRNAYYMAAAKCMICCNRFLLPWHKEQVAVYLAHGTPMKSVRSYYTMPESIHHCLSAAAGVEEMTAYQFNADPKKMFSLGYPRNDILTQPPQPVKQMLETTCKKVIVWYPTFRQHANGMKTGSSNALPIIHDAQAALKLNEWAREQDVLLVLKPHFAQDLTQIKNLQLSNIRFIGDDFFREHNTTSYGFVAGCDALITDYSSIYFDYMLCDKPIGLVWEDVEEYCKNPGFAIDIEDFGKGGVKIYTLEDFKNFVREVATDTDSCQEERRRLRDLTNHSTDGENARRVTDFIIEKADL